MTTSIHALLTIDIRSEHDVVLARQRARQIAGLLGFDIAAQTKVSTAVSEIVHNAFWYAGSGTIAFNLEETDPRRLSITLTDQGPGIPNLEDIFAGRYRSTTGMGLGLIGTRRIMDDFEISHPLTGGTTVWMTKNLPPRAPRVTSHVRSSIALALTKGVPGNPLGEVQHQNRELLGVLSELQERNLASNRQNQELERVLAELQARQDQLLVVNRDLEYFASTASHDLQEPLRMVSSCLGLLSHRSRAKLDDKERGYLSRAVDGANRMSRMVRDLLTFATADSAMVTKRPVDASEIVGDALKNLSLKITEVQATITVEELPSIHGDRVLLAQVFQNLLSNGIKFHAERIPDITISASRQGDQHVFRIRDNGIGIPAQNVEQIFGLFQRLHLADQYPGMGIGLSLCKRIVERHGGNIGVESIVGTGSTFWFSIPA